MKATRRQICFVTNELYPSTAGGIGRLITNLIRDALDRAVNADFHVLVPHWSPIQEDAVDAAFSGRVALHRATSLDAREHRERWGASYPPRWAFSDTPNHADSLELMLKLKHLEGEGLRFDVVEFPDYLGWAFATLQERRQGLGFTATTVAVRLHSTDGIVQHYEGTAPTMLHLGTFELERRALEDADVVVAHLEAIVDANVRFYGFDDAWRRKVVTEFPPIVTGGAARPRAPEGARPIAFVTKVQHVKRPDLFVRGAALFFAANPEYPGRAVFACHMPSDDFARTIRRMVPAAFADRFSFPGPQVREELIRDGVVVIPSEYESLNLAAYEAAAAGATLVLNGACPAFKPGSPFVDGVNCHLFDGTPEGLAAALERATTSPHPRSVEHRAAVPYFERPLKDRPSLSKLNAAKVSVLITNHNLAAWLPKAIESVAASTWDNLELVVVDDASTEPLDAAVLKTLETGAQGLPIKVVRNAVNRGLAASRNIGLRHCTGDFVMPLDADDRIGPRFLEQAVHALTVSPEFDVVVPTTGYFVGDDQVEARHFVDYACFLGNVPTLGLLANRFSTATALMRREVVQRFGYDEALDSYEDWSLYLRMSHAGVRFLVTNEIHFHYRRREGSMVRGVAAQRHLRLLSRLHDTVPRPMPASVATRFLPTMLSIGKAPEPEAVETAVETLVPMRYRLADRANELVKRAPAMHQRLKDNLGTMAAHQQRPLRYEVSDRLNEFVKQVPALHAWLKRASR